MKKFKKYEVGRNIIILQDKGSLYFEGQFNAKHPMQVMVAMLAVAKYLHWSILPDPDGKEAQITYSKTGRTIYINHCVWMKICQTGNCCWACLTKKQIQQLVNLFYSTEDTSDLPEEVAMLTGFPVIIEMLGIKKLEPYVEFNSEDYSRACEKFENFIENNCKGPRGSRFEFDLKTFQHETQLITKSLISHFFHNIYEMYSFGEDKSWVDYEIHGGTIIIKKE